MGNYGMAPWGAAMHIEIAPNFSCDDWDRLKAKLDPHGDWDASPAEWKRAIEVVEGRIRTRFLDSADQLQAVAYAGFAILALDCLLIETIQAFKNGKHAETPKESRRAYETFLTSSPRFQKYFSSPRVQDFYTNMRNGLLHDGETRKGWLVKANPQYDLVDPQPDGSIIVNRERFHDVLVKDFKAYVRDLSNPANKELRQNLVSAINDLCDRSRPKP